MSDVSTRLKSALEGRYRIERELGEGGMATVYLADDLRHERKAPDPHILPLFDSGEAEPPTISELLVVENFHEELLARVGRYARGAWTSAPESRQDRETSMQPSEIEGVLTFLRSAEQLKNTVRSAWTSSGQPESVAQHTWRLCLMAMVFAPSYPDVDFARLVKICVIHDLGEAIGGDIPAIDQVPGESKAAQEREDLLELLAPLPDPLRDEITELWDEYEAAESPEARVAKGLDKLETIMQHNQGLNPSDFDYAFNLGYGTRYTVGDTVIETVRAILDRETAERARESGQDV